MKIAVIGGVTSTQLLIEKLHRHNFRDVDVYGYAPAETENVSGWVDLRKVAGKFGFRFFPFVRVDQCVAPIADQKPEIIFAVGLSQIIPKEILDIPRLGSIGFHPTALPKGRGRAPIAWLVLENKNGAATFFHMRQGVDDGPILAQVPFTVNELDTAATVEAKILLAEGEALDNCLPEILNGKVAAAEQEHEKATWYGRRTPDDGWINWHESANKISALIRASSLPHPGAYTFSGQHRIKIWAAHIESNTAMRGVVGRILQVDGDSKFTVQCGENQLITVTEWDAKNDWIPKVGSLLGYYQELEIFNLKTKQIYLESKIERLEKLFGEFMRIT